MRNNRWMLAVAAVVLAVIVGGVAYNFGVAQGLEQSGAAIAAPGGPYPHHWHRPWGFPFYFAPFFFILFWLFVARMLFGRSRWSRRCGGGIDEWHRRAHERMWNDPSGSGAPREGTSRP